MNRRCDNDFERTTRAPAKNLPFRKGLLSISRVNVLTLAILVSITASRLQAASYEVGMSDSGRIDKPSYLYTPDVPWLRNLPDGFSSRSFYAFSLPPLQGTIISAQLQIKSLIVREVGFFGFSTILAYDFLEPSPDLEQVFDDWGSGRFYGSQIVTEDDHLNLTPVILSLSADAVEDLNMTNPGGSFFVGLSLDAGDIMPPGLLNSESVKLIVETDAPPEPVEPVELSDLKLTGDTLTVTVRNVPAGQVHHLRQSADLVTFAPLSPPLSITGTGSPQMVTITLDTPPPARLFLRVYEGASP